MFGRKAHVFALVGGHLGTVCLFITSNIAVLKDNRTISLVSHLVFLPNSFKFNHQLH